MTHKLNQISQELVEKAVGLSFKTIKEEDAVTIDKAIEKRKKIKLKHKSPKGSELETRGNPLVYYGRLKEEEDMEKDVSKILKKKKRK